MTLAANGIRDPLAYRLHGGLAYSAIDSGQQNVIDDCATRALLRIEQFADWYAREGSADNAPSAWLSWYLLEALLDAAIWEHPDKQTAIRRERNQARADALATYQRKAIDYDPSSDTESFDFHFQAVRHYVVGTCVKLDKPFFPSVESVDAAIMAVLRKLWNRAGWTVRKRPVRIRIAPITISDGNWDEDPGDITSIDSSSYTVATNVKDIVHIRDGTDVVKGDYAIASKPGGTSIRLESSIAPGAADLSNTDIDGTIVAVRVFGLDASESFDAIASHSLRFTDIQYESERIVWADSDEWAKCRAEDGTDTGRPRVFRMRRNADSYSWYVTPTPDQAYEVQAEVLTKTPADPTSASDTNPFGGEWFSESLPTIRDMALLEVLTNYGRTNRDLMNRVMEERHDLKEMQDPGPVDDRGSVVDVNHDHEYMMGGEDIGGAI